MLCSTCKKEFPIECFYKVKRKYPRYQCKKCEKISQQEYSNTEKGFMSRLYIRMRGRLNQKRFKDCSEKQKNAHICNLTKEQFLKKWEEHKLKYGYRCALSGEEIVHKTTDRERTNKSNSISVDRLNPAIGYTEENIIFVSNKVNNMKNAVTKELCIAIVKAHEERGV
jgi:hypothetical protein